MRFIRRKPRSRTWKTPTSDSAAASAEDGRPTAGQTAAAKTPGDESVAVDENQTAGVEHDRPSSRGVNYAITDIHCVPNHIAKIFDYSATDLSVRPRIYPHPRIHRHAAIAGIASNPSSAFHPSFHPSSPPSCM